MEDSAILNAFGIKPSEPQEQRELPIEEAREEQVEPEQEEEVVEAQGEESEAEEATDENAEESTDEVEGYEDVEYEGKQYKLPKELKDAVLRQADYTRKTQELAEMRRATEAEKEYVQKAAEFQTKYRDQFTQLSVLDAQLQMYSNVNWTDLSESDPVEAQKQFFRFSQMKDARRAAEQQLMQLQEQQSQEESQRYQQILQDGAKELQRSIKGWSPDLGQKLIGYGKNNGFDDKEMRSIVDPRVVKILHKAMLYDQLQSSKPAIAKKVQGVPKVVKPGNAQSSQQKNAQRVDDAMSRLKKSGSVDDAAAVFLASMRKG